MNWSHRSLCPFPRVTEKLQASSYQEEYFLWTRIHRPPSCPLRNSPGGRPPGPPPRLCNSAWAVSCICNLPSPLPPLLSIHQSSPLPFHLIIHFFIFQPSMPPHALHPSTRLLNGPPNLHLGAHLTTVASRMCEPFTIHPSIFSPGQCSSRAGRARISVRCLIFPLYHVPSGQSNR